MSKPERYVRVAEFVHRQPHDFSKPAQFAGGEHVILIRTALLSYNKLTAKNLMDESWSILPQKIEGTTYVGMPVDATEFLEKKTLVDVRKYPIKEYANYTALVEFLKAKFLEADRDANLCRGEAQKHQPGSEEHSRYTSYAENFQTASLIIADALDSVQVHGQ